MSAERQVAAADLQALSPEARALARTWLLAPPPHFLRQLRHVLLALGALQLLVGSIELVAANWSTLGRWGRLGLLEVALFAAFASAWRLGADSLGGRWSLTLASGLVGALLAAIGQTFQTGADSFLLFATWGLLIVPWVLAAGFGPLTALWWVVVNLATELMLQQRFADLGEGWLVILGLNALACGLALGRAQIALARLAGAFALIAACAHSFDSSWGLVGLGFTLLLAVLARRPDLALFAASLLGLVIHSVLLMPRNVLHSAGGLLFTAALVVVELAVAARVIRDTQARNR